MPNELIDELRNSLAESDSELRKHWTEQIVSQKTRLSELMCLWHSDTKTAQRFMWLLGDICEVKPQLVADCMPFLFGLRFSMPFPGMDRSLAKWLWLTDVPSTVENEAVDQLFQWLSSPEVPVACKSYAAKALVSLAGQKRCSTEMLATVLELESHSSNRAYGLRIGKELEKLMRHANREEQAN